MSQDGRTRDPENPESDAAAPELLWRVRETDHDGRDPGAVMSTATDELAAAELVDTDPEVAFDEELVTGSLDELLLGLIAVREEGTHGTGLIADLERVFGVEPSPGTVYPRLHALDDEGTLDRHDLVRTKQYAVADAGTASGTRRSSTSRSGSSWRRPPTQCNRTQRAYSAGDQPHTEHAVASVPCTPPQSGHCFLL